MAVRQINARDLPNATREELLGALDPGSTVTAQLVLAQLAHISSTKAEGRMIKLTVQIRWLTVVAVVAAFLALIIALVK